MVWETYAKIWYACGQFEIQCVEYGINKYIHNHTCVFFSVRNAQQNYALPKIIRIYRVTIKEINTFNVM